MSRTQCDLFIVCQLSGKLYGMITLTFVFARTQEKIPSGIDMVIYVDAPRETVLQRSLGRLYDPVTGEK